MALPSSDEVKGKWKQRAGKAKKQVKDFFNQQ